MTPLATSYARGFTFAAGQSLTGTNVSFAGVPPYVSEIVMIIDGANHTTSNLRVRIGDSGGMETTGYIGASSRVTNAAATSVVDHTAGFIINSIPATPATGIMRLVEHQSNVWGEEHSLTTSTTSSAFGGGRKTLSGTLSQIELTLTGGTFTSGTVTIGYR